MKYTNNSTKFEAKLREAARESLSETGEEVLALVKEYAPVKTGELRDSYAIEQTDDNKITIGSPLERAKFSEFGTFKEAPRPHLAPAMLQAKEVLKKKFEEKMK